MAALVLEPIVVMVEPAVDGDGLGVLGISVVVTGVSFTTMVDS